MDLGIFMPCSLVFCKVTLGLHFQLLVSAFCNRQISGSQYCKWKCSMPIFLFIFNFKVAFWKALSGQTKYQTSERLESKSIIRPPRLFACSNKTGRFIVSIKPIKSKGFNFSEQKRDQWIWVFAKCQKCKFCNKHNYKYSLMKFHL